MQLISDSIYLPPIKLNHKVVKRISKQLLIVVNNTPKVIVVIIIIITIVSIDDLRINTKIHAIKPQISHPLRRFTKP